MRTSVATAEPQPVEASDIIEARRRIENRVLRTPVERAERLSAELGTDVLLKLECWQRTRAFKVRGAFNAVTRLSPEERSRGLVTASAGNHGQALALAGRDLSAPVVVYVPHNAPATKRNRIRRYGAELRTAAADYDEAEQLARDHAAEHGSVLVHAFSDAAVVAGQGTLALEILEDVPHLRDVIVPVGGGGLIAGMGVALRALARDVRIIGVQSTATRAMHESLRAGHAVPVPIPPTLADGLAGCTDDISVQRVRAVIDELVLVEEAEIAAAIAGLHASEGVLAEGAGAVGVAALMSGRVRPRGTAVVLVTGGNIDGATAARILAGSGAEEY
jgi:threonine dehydratase